MTLPALALQDVRKRFGASEIIGGVSLAVQPGERVAVIGPNGAGKSTLFDLISGRTRPDGGQIWLHGARVDGKRPFEINRMGLSRSFQVSRVFGGLSVQDNLRCAALWALGYRYSLLRWLGRLRDVNQRADELLERTRLAHRRHALAAHLAYAEQRALEIGITLAGSARVVLLDEPTAGMNADETAHFIGLIRELTAGRTLLMVEHDMGVVFSLADRIAVLAQGRLLAFDTPGAVRADARVKAVYLGSEADGPDSPGSPDSLQAAAHAGERA